MPECSRQQAVEWDVSAGSRLNLGLLFPWGIPNVSFFCTSAHVWFSSEACVVSPPFPFTQGMSNLRAYLGAGNSRRRKATYYVLQ